MGDITKARAALERNRYNRSGFVLKSANCLCCGLGIFKGHKVMDGWECDSCHREACHDCETGFATHLPGSVR